MTSERPQPDIGELMAKGERFSRLVAKRAGLVDTLSEMAADPNVSIIRRRRLEGVRATVEEAKDRFGNLLSQTTEQLDQVLPQAINQAQEELTQKRRDLARVTNMAARGRLSLTGDDLKAFGGEIAELETKLQRLETLRNRRGEPAQSAQPSPTPEAPPEPPLPPVAPQAPETPVGVPIPPVEQAGSKLPQMIIDLKTGDVTVDGAVKKVPGQGTQAALTVLAQNANRTVRWQNIARAVRETGSRGKFPAGNAIRRLRLDFELDPQHPVLIISSGRGKGTGYRLVAQVSFTGEAKAEETPDAQKRRRYQEATQLFEVILPDGQVAKIQGKKKADLLKALLAKAGCHASAEELCRDVYAQYALDLVHSLNPLIRSLKRDLIRYDYQIVQPVGPGERGQGKRADYHLKSIIREETAPAEAKAEISPELRRRVGDLVLTNMQEKLFDLMLEVGPLNDIPRDVLIERLYGVKIRDGRTTYEKAVASVQVLWGNLKRKFEMEAGRIIMRNRTYQQGNATGVYYWEEATVAPVVGPEEEAVEAALPEETAVPVGPIRREGEEPIRVPVKRTKEELRTPLENALLTYVVDWLTQHNDLYFDRLHQAIAPFNGPRIREEGGLRKFFPYSARELQDSFELALQKLANDALFEEANEDWADREVWKKVQDLRDIMHATDLHDLLRKTKIEIAKSERQFKAINPPQDGGRVWWITL